MTSTLKNFLESELTGWPLVQSNFRALAGVQTREVNIGGFPVRLQFNPARIRSTAAKVDAKSVQARSCFLCAANRPIEQKALEFKAYEDYQILVNPFPIAPQHFTVAAHRHKHQDLLNPGDMAKFVRENPGYVAFYNGSRSGASAPDHLHFQACNREFLHSLIDSLQANPGSLMAVNAGTHFYDACDLPVHAVHITAPEFTPEAGKWLKALLPADPETCAPALGMRNILMWTDSEDSLHILHIPRLAHRPDCYFAEGEQQMLVSPGALDMAGVIILPRKEDFDRITSADIRRIYSQVSLNYKELPAFQNLMLL